MALCIAGSVPGQGPESPCSLHSQVLCTPGIPPNPLSSRVFFLKIKFSLSGEEEQRDVFRLGAVWWRMRQSQLLQESVRHTGSLRAQMPPAAFGVSFTYCRATHSSWSTKGSVIPHHHGPARSCCGLCFCC